MKENEKTKHTIRKASTTFIAVEKINFNLEFCFRTTVWPPFFQTGHGAEPKQSGQKNLGERVAQDGADCCDTSSIQGPCGAKKENL
eukprot:6208298-Amphidinium_carterae.1